MNEQAPHTDRDPAASPANSPDAGRLWRLPFVQVLLMQFCYGLSFSSFFLLPKFLEQELHATPAQIGTTIAVGLFSAVAAAPIVGWNIDRWPRRPMLLVGSLLGAVTAYAHTWVSEVGWLLYMLRVLQGVAFITVFNSAGTLAVEYAPPARLGQALGYFGVAMLCTNAIAPAIIEPIASSAGWSIGFEFAAVAAGSAVLVASSLPSSPGSSRPGQHEIPRRLATLSNRRSLRIGLASLIMGVGFGTLFTFLQPFALSQGMDEVSGLFVGYTLAALFVRTLLGSLADRLGRRLVAGMAMALYGVVVSAGSLLQPGWLFPIGLGLGVAHGLLYPALNALLIQDTPEPVRGLAMTAYNASFNLGFAASVIGLGFIAELAGFKIVFLLAGGATLGGLLTLKGLQPAPNPEFERS